MIRQIHCSACNNIIDSDSEDSIAIKSLHDGRLHFCNVSCLFSYMRSNNEYLVIGKNFKEIKQ
ncbi:MAG: hypothetical protein [Caudoviricetes sp.]|nr:MAG: hypothetical protein [Caudoviricetes sp.]